MAVAERVDRAISGRFVIDDTEVFVGASIGIACPVDVDVDPETLIRDADAAMYRAKDRGGPAGSCSTTPCGPAPSTGSTSRPPCAAPSSGASCASSTSPSSSCGPAWSTASRPSLRWEHPERGLLNPDEFIGVAEETGLIVPIGAWVLDQACRQVQRWQAEVPTLAPLRLSVNLSGRQLGHTQLVADVASVLTETGIDPEMVELEITESVLMDDVEMSQETLTRLHLLGVKLAIDDFGTGYSSMSYLRRFPVDLLKVDRSFVESLDEESDEGSGDSAIVTAIVTLAHTLGLSAVAEGVESAAQLAMLRQIGCDRAQGFYMARPGTDHEIGQLLRTDAHW